MALTSVVTACTSGPLAAPPAASVDGIEISRQELTDFVDATERFYEQADELGLDETGAAAALLEGFAGAGEQTTSRDTVTNALTALVTTELVRAELERNDALPTKSDLDAVRASLEQQFTKETVDKIDPEYLEFSIASRARIQALQIAVAAELDAEQQAIDPDEVEAQRQALFEELAPTQPICVNTLQVAAEAEAQAARARVDDGESFGAVAADVSLRETIEEDGGFFACGTAEQIQSSFETDVANAVTGNVFGPFEAPSPDGSPATWGVLEIDGTEGPTYEQVLPQLEQQIPSEVVPTDPTQLDPAEAIAGLAADATITVDPRFGAWDAATGTIAPPAVIGINTTTTTAAPELVGS